MFSGKGPEQFEIYQYLWVVGLAILGGIVSYLKKLKHGRKWKWKDAAIELITSAFAGIITFLLCQWAGFGELGSSAVAGIAGRYSDHSMLLFKHVLDRVLNKVEK